MFTRPQRATATVPVVSAAVSGKPLTADSEKEIAHQIDPERLRHDDAEVPLDRGARLHGDVRKQRHEHAIVLVLQANPETARLVFDDEGARRRPSAILRELGERPRVLDAVQRRERRRRRVAIVDVEGEPRALQGKRCRIGVDPEHSFRALDVELGDRVGDVVHRSPTAEADLAERRQRDERQRGRAPGARRVASHRRSPSA